MRVIPRGAPSRTLELPLPPEPAAIRLLRNPFEVARLAPLHKALAVSSEPEPLLCPSGRRFFLRSLTGLWMVSIPKSPNDTAPAPRHLALLPGRRALGVGVWKRRVLVLAEVEGSGLAAQTYNMKGSRAPREASFEEGDFVRPGADQALRSVVFQGGDPLVVDGIGQLFRLSLTADDTAAADRPLRVTWGVEALSYASGHVILFCDQRAPPEARLHAPDLPPPFTMTARLDGSTLTDHTELEMSRPPRVFVAPSQGGSAWRLGAFATRLPEGAWRLVGRLGSRATLDDPPEDAVMGLSQDASETPALVTLDGARTRIGLVGPRGARTLAELDAPARAVASTWEAVLWIEDGGAVVIYSPRYQRELLRLRLERLP